MANQAVLEKRVAALESKVDQLLRGLRRRKDWQRTLGTFAGDELMKRIDEEGRKIREADRRATIASLEAEDGR